MLRNSRNIFIAVILITPFILIYLNKNVHETHETKINKAKLQDKF